METETTKLEGYRKLLTAYLPMLGTLLAALPAAGIPATTAVYVIAALAGVYIIAQGAVDFAKALGKSKATPPPEAIAAAALGAVLAALKNAGLNVATPGVNAPAPGVNIAPPPANP